MSRTFPVALAALLVACAAQMVTSAQAQSRREPEPLDITITANRSPTAIQRTGSAVTIIRAEEIARASSYSVADVLRQVPGVEVSTNGGPGGTSTIRMRGANSGQTLVLLDGVRITDPSGASGEFDASLIAPGIIERIEVLRGPQSALYGSDAMGGVINIITRKGRGAPSRSLRFEGGSYGSASVTGSVAGSSGPWSYAFSGLGQTSEGFSSYGYRIGRLEKTRGPFENDGLRRLTGLGRIGYDPGTGFRLDLGMIASGRRSGYDAAFGAHPDTKSISNQRFGQFHARAELDSFDNRFTHSLQIFANRTERVLKDSFLSGGPPPTNFRTDYEFWGNRFGAEYQGTLRLDRFGKLILGARSEREAAASANQDIGPFPGSRSKDFSGRQDTNSVFGLWQLPVGERLMLSFGTRLDQVSDSRSFATWRATAAYNLPETGTKLRASAGTGAKSPTLYQRFSPLYGTRNLRPEDSLGLDVGIDQGFFNNRVTLSVTGFRNRFRDLIDFQFAGCPPAQPFGCYFNVARAKTAGVEFAGTFIAIERWLAITGSYTYLHAKDQRTNLTLARRAPHQGRAALQITPREGWLIEPSVIMASSRFSSANETNPLKRYARFDVHTEYALNSTFKLHLRFENITNARYEEVRDYGTTGRAVHGGVTATW
ncbi:MAG: TonB-dependent receptor [Methylobacterium sp.]|nr:TonB-dependent receptor [Methylobacterium sp.]MCA3603627.1 TonB-dependent receptor [Methylobacterium sp.]MCA3614451.1 TonB-dependent receptor [Methylobacterium sp.]MCA4909668.1 TonB-dependent receptor [Methylobacterium sp.]